MITLFASIYGMIIVGEIKVNFANVTFVYYYQGVVEGTLVVIAMVTSYVLGVVLTILDYVKRKAKRCVAMVLVWVVPLVLFAINKDTVGPFDWFVDKIILFQIGYPEVAIFWSLSLLLVVVYVTSIVKTNIEESQTSLR